MPAKLHIVRAGLWDRTFRRLSKEAKIVALQVYTSSLRASEGLFEQSLGHFAVDTNLTVDEIRQALDELANVNLINYDEDTEVVLDRLALRTNPLRNPRDKDGEPKLYEKGEKVGEPRIDNRIPHAVKLFSQLPDSHLKVEFIGLADKYSPDLADAIRSESSYSYPEAPSKPLTKPLASPSEGAGVAPSSSESESFSDGESQSRGEVHPLEPVELVKSEDGTDDPRSHCRDAELRMVNEEW